MNHIVPSVTESEVELDMSGYQPTKSSLQHDSTKTSEAVEQESKLASSDPISLSGSAKQLRLQYSRRVLEKWPVDRYEFPHVQLRPRNLLPWTQHIRVERHDYPFSSDFILRGCAFPLPGTQWRYSTVAAQCPNEAVSALGSFTCSPTGKKGLKLEKIVGICRSHRDSMIADDGLQILAVCGVSGIPSAFSCAPRKGLSAQTTLLKQSKLGTDDKSTTLMVGSSGDNQDSSCQWLATLQKPQPSQTMRYCSAAHFMASLGQLSPVISGCNQPDTNNMDLYYVPNRFAHKRRNPTFKPITRMMVPAEHLINFTFSNSVDASVDFKTDEHGKYTSFWIKPKLFLGNKVSDDPKSEMTVPELLIRVYRDTSEEHMMVLHSISSTCSSKLAPYDPYTPEDSMDTGAQQPAVDTAAANTDPQEPRLFHPASPCASTDCEIIAFRAHGNSEYCEYHYPRRRQGVQ